MIGVPDLGSGLQCLGSMGEYLLAASLELESGFSDVRAGIWDLGSGIW
jgi:hypothetical protein